jgi:hypothetical protein
VNIFVTFQPGHIRQLAGASSVTVAVGTHKEDEEVDEKDEDEEKANKSDEGESFLAVKGPRVTPIDPQAEGDDVGHTTKVQVVITGRPSTGVDELPLVKDLITKALEKGLLEAVLDDMIFEVADLRPEIVNLDFAATQISQWSVPDCSAHMKKMVHAFSMSYTRRMVPTAIYNECTNFMPKVSFSHDSIPSNLDKRKCREATVIFARTWNFGKVELETKVGPPPAPALRPVASPAASPAASLAGDSTAAGEEFQDFCLDVCSAKYGDGAPQCHVTFGRRMLNKKP